MTDTPRAIDSFITKHHLREGAGFTVRRPFPNGDLSYIDPFLLIDEMGPADYAPGEAIGAPDHPHRGLKTVTSMLEGEFEQEGPANRKGTLRPGSATVMRL